MVLAKEAGKKPRELAELIAENHAPRTTLIAKVDVADRAHKPDAEGVACGIPCVADRRWAGLRPRAARKDAVNVVRCRPIRPAHHVGHGRGAVFGDALANLLASPGTR